MTIKCLLVTTILVALSNCADHDTYKDCSRVGFCTDLRSRPLADLTVLSSDTTSPCSADRGSTFDLVTDPFDTRLRIRVSLVQIEENIFRIKAREFDSEADDYTSDPYELKDVLDGELGCWEFLQQVADDDGTLELSFDDSSIAKIYASPFNIEFIKDGVTEVVFNGDHLSLTTNGDNAAFSFGVTFPEGDQLYGLHEHCDTTALGNTAPGNVDPYRLKNSDVSYYELNSTMALYGAVPVIYGHGPRATSGIFLHNAAEQWIDISNHPDGGSQAYFMVENGALDLFVLLGPTPTDVIRQYTNLTGRAHLPQLWTLGYHQSRYSYDTQDDAQTVAASFDTYNFQLDALWLDIDYTDGYKYFTWNYDTFPDPVQLQNTLASTNKKLVTISDPHIKVEPGWSIYDGALGNDLFVKNSDGSVFQGQCWPGLSSYLDFLNPAARDYYSSLYSYYNFPDTTPTLAGIWNDMNEPSVFDNSLEMTLPANSLQFGGVTHSTIHNIYGFLQTMATHQGLLQRDNGDRRPFILTRSHFAGSQRYAAFWTGDNTADWPYLHAAFQECLSANILGIVFCGADVGGFFYNPSNELFERWYQAGAWLPFYRAHSTKDSQRREPYLLPDDSQDVIRNAIQTRYKHLPVWYTLFYEHTRSGDPLIRPLFYQYPEDVNVYAIDDELLVGRDILVKAVTKPGVDSVDVYFPGENEVWVSATNDDVQAGSGLVSVPVTRDSIPIYYRSGGVIIRKDTVRPNTVEMVDDGYTIYYTTDASGAAQGTVYLDDGLSFKYRDASDYNYIRVDVLGDSITFETIDGDGDYQFVLEKLVKREVIEMPTVKKAGAYKETIITTDANGVLLKNRKIVLKSKTTLKLM